MKLPNLQPDLWDSQPFERWPWLLAPLRLWGLLFTLSVMGEITAVGLGLYYPLEVLVIGVFANLLGVTLLGYIFA